MTTLRASARAEDLQSGRVTVSETVTEAEWDRYLATQPGATADHLWGWGRVIAKVFGHTPAYLAAKRNDAIVGVLPLVLFHSRMFGRAVKSVPFLNYGGIVAEDREAAAALLGQASSIASSFRAAHLELRHAGRQFEHLPYRQHKLALTRTLPGTSDLLWNGTDRKVRNQVRKAQKAALEVFLGRDDLLDDFYGVFARNMRDLGTPVYPREFFQEILQVFPGRVRVTVVRLGRQTVASAVTIRWRDTVLVPWASSLRDYRHLCPNMLLYWAMLEQAVSDGAARFDFGRSSPGSGPHQFKLQWGARETPLIWEYVLLNGGTVPDQGPSNPKFRLAIEIWKRLPVGVTTRVGPWIASHLP